MGGFRPSQYLLRMETEDPAGWNAGYYEVMPDDADDPWSNKYCEMGLKGSDRALLGALDATILVIFSVEVVIKFIAEGVFMYRFFRCGGGDRTRVGFRNPR